MYQVADDDLYYKDTGLDLRSKDPYPRGSWIKPAGKKVVFRYVSGDGTIQPWPKRSEHKIVYKKINVDGARSRRPMYPESPMSPMSPMSPGGYYPTAKSNPIFQGMPGEVDAVRHSRMPYSPPLTSASVDAWERNTEPRGFTRNRRYEPRHGYDDAISHVSDSQWTNNKLAWHDFYNYDLCRIPRAHLETLPNSTKYMWRTQSDMNLKRT